MNSENKFKEYRKNTTDKGFISLVITQFLGAFNDNGFKTVISLYLVAKLMKSDNPDTTYVTLAAALFILPFILFSTYSGYFADKLSKRKVMIFTKFLEIVIMVFGLIAFYYAHVPSIFFVLFLMGTQSTIFSPAKYGIIPEILKGEELSKGNGIIELTTFLAIIFGTVFGTVLFINYTENVYFCSFYFILIAVIGTLSSFFIVKVPPVGIEEKLKINFLSDVYTDLKRASKIRSLILTILAASVFWFLATAVHTNLLTYSKEMMKIPESSTDLGYLLTALALGIGLGSGLAGFISGKSIEFRLIPLAAFGMTLFLIDLKFAFFSLNRTLIYLFMTGIFGGFFIVPLNANLQKQAPKGETGRTIGLTNFVANTFMVISSVFLWILHEKFQIRSDMIFAILGGIAFVTGIITLKFVNFRKIDSPFHDVDENFHKNIIAFWSWENAPEQFKNCELSPLPQWVIILSPENRSIFKKLSLIVKKEKELDDGRIILYTN